MVDDKPKGSTKKTPKKKDGDRVVDIDLLMHIPTTTKYEHKDIRITIKDVEVKNLTETLEIVNREFDRGCIKSRNFVTQQMEPEAIIEYIKGD